MNRENHPILIIKKTADLIDISVTTINRLIKKGKFPQKRNLVGSKYINKKTLDDLFLSLLNLFELPGLKQMNLSKPFIINHSRANDHFLSK